MQVSQSSKSAGASQEMLFEVENGCGPNGQKSRTNKMRASPEGPRAL